MNQFGRSYYNNSGDEWKKVQVEEEINKLWHIIVLINVKLAFNILCTCK